MGAQEIDRPGVSDKIERFAKTASAIIAICGALLGVSSWLFNSAMSSRDRHIESLSSEIRSLKSDLKDSSSRAGAKLDSLSNDVIRLKIAIIASRSETGMRAEEIDLLSRSSRRSRPRPGGSPPRNGEQPHQRIDDLMDYTASDQQSDYVTQLYQSVVDVGGDSIVIDNPETAMTVFNEAISQVESEPTVPLEASPEATPEPVQQEQPVNSQNK
jgi:hypothetical protein